MKKRGVPFFVLLLLLVVGVAASAQESQNREANVTVSIILESYMDIAVLEGDYISFTDWNLDNDPVNPALVASEYIANHLQVRTNHSNWQISVKSPAATAFYGQGGSLTIKLDDFSGSGGFPAVTLDMNNTQGSVATYDGNGKGVKSFSATYTARAPLADVDFDLEDQITLTYTIVAL